MSSGIKTNGTRKFAVLDLAGVSQQLASINLVAVSKVVESALASKSVSAPTKIPTATIATNEDHLYKSTLSIEERVAVAMSVGEEIVTEEELTAMYKGVHLSSCHYQSVELIQSMSSSSIRESMIQLHFISYSSPRLLT